MDEAREELARQVHYAFLPQGYEDDAFRVAVRVIPRDGLGGDYCGISPLPEGRLALTMCDATGHDIASALFAARINTYVLGRLPRRQSPSGLIESLNEFLTKRMGGTPMQATFCALLLDPTTDAYAFAGAGHPPVLHYACEAQSVTRLFSQTTMVGAFDDLRVPAATTSGAFVPGDRIVLYTDGLIDVRSAAGEAFGLERLEATVLEHAALPLEDFHDALVAAARAHGGGDLDDDALVMTAQRTIGV